MPDADANTPAPTLRLHENDDVAVARVDLAPGTPVAGSNATAIEPIPAGHKVALREVAEGVPFANTTRSSASRARPSHPAPTFIPITSAWAISPATPASAKTREPIAVILASHGSRWVAPVSR